MTGWDGVSLDDLRAELDTYADADDLGTGWLTMAELAKKFGVNRHLMASMVAELEQHGRVEKAERIGRRIDGARCRRVVYRLVEAIR